MAKIGQIYKCQVCGNIIEVLHEGEGELICCGQPMNLMPEKTEEEGFTEKHLPVIEKIETGVKVKIGSMPHPMEESHYIEWIKIETTDGRVCRRYLKPGDQPEGEFKVSEKEIAAVHEYCNLHGLWVKR